MSVECNNQEDNIWVVISSKEECQEQVARCRIIIEVDLTKEVVIEEVTEEAEVATSKEEDLVEISHILNSNSHIKCQDNTLI
jgi:hypothetical protein